MFVIGKFIMLSEDYTSPEETDPIVVQIPQVCAGLRLDQALAQLFSEFSRSRLQRWVREGHVLLNGAAATAKSKVWSGDAVTLQVPEEEGSEDIAPEAISIEVVYEDDALLVINKPAGLVVHPGNGNRSGTLQNALLHYDSRLGPVPRCGIVHRLDKDTSGLMVVARTLQAHAELVRQLQARTVHRHYWALVQGHIQDDGTVDAPIGRHPTQRTRMAVVSGGRPAVTHFHVVERLPCHTWIECRLETGRTHQIRVHLQHLGFPLAGDPVYGGRGLRLDPRSQSALKSFGRQALHAFRLGLVHPVSGEPVSWEIAMASDMAALIAVLREARHE
ncbi:MAG: 23S rRNA pseudouridine(1911/1915/1917) synthase RluD [Betaproteobacteria bacterium]|nr:23S rRNA pseudouridine(1911/1915/1917) synthase RluD [Betaproteobacteria bacterium]